MLETADKLEDVIFNKIKGDFESIKTETYKSISTIKSESLEQVYNNPYIFKTSSGKYIGIDCNEAIEIALIPHHIYYEQVAKDFLKIIY